MHVHMAFAGVINACYCPYGLRLVQRGIGFRADEEAEEDEEAGPLNFGCDCLATKALL